MRRFNGRLRLVCALVAAACAIVLAQPVMSASADPLASVDNTEIGANAQLAERSLTVSGRLTGVRAQPLGGQRVDLSIDGQLRASAQTDASGGFSFSLELPADVGPGDHPMTVSFAGSGSMLPSKKEFVLQPTDKASTRITGAIDQDVVMSGYQVLISGRLTTTSGAVVSGARIDLVGPSGTIEEATQQTASDGSFSTFYLVPDDQGDGTITLTAKFAGTDKLSASSTSWKVSVEASTEDASPSPSASPASPSASASAESSPAVGAGPSAQAVAPPSQGSGGIMFPMLLGGLAVGAIGLAAGAVMWRRSRPAGASAADVSPDTMPLLGEGGLLGFDDPDDTPAPRRGAT